MTICLVEDDSLYSTFIIEEIEQELPGIVVRSYATELEFIEDFTSLEERPPLLFILDIMIRWASPEDLSPDTVAPQVEDYLHAGIRLLKRIRSSERLAEVPVVLHSVYARTEAGIDELPPATLYRQKSEDLGELIRPLRAFLAAQTDLPKHRGHRIKDAGEAVKLAPEFMGVSVDLKKLWQAIRRG